MIDPNLEGALCSASTITSLGSHILLTPKSQQPNKRSSKAKQVKTSNESQTGPKSRRPCHVSAKFFGRTPRPFAARRVVEFSLTATVSIVARYQNSNDFLSFTFLLHSAFSRPQLPPKQIMSCIKSLLCPKSKNKAVDVPPETLEERWARVRASVFLHLLALTLHTRSPARRVTQAHPKPHRLWPHAWRSGKRGGGLGTTSA